MTYRFCYVKVTSKNTQIKYNKIHQRRLCWSVYVVTMEDDSIPKQFLYGELSQGKRLAHTVNCELTST